MEVHVYQFAVIFAGLAVVCLALISLRVSVKERAITSRLSRAFHIPFPGGMDIGCTAPEVATVYRRYGIRHSQPWAGDVIESTNSRRKQIFASD